MSEKEIKDSGEVWKPVVGYEGLYEVSNLGRVKSKRKNTRIADKENQIMCQKFDNHGYKRVNVTDENGRHKAMLVSRMVAKAFIPNPDNLPQVGHNDDDKLNNNVENLYWTDSKENNNHNGKMERFQETHKQKMPQIIKAISTPVEGTNIHTGETIRFESMQEAQRNGFCSGKISLCCAGKRNMHKSYKWRKIDEN